MPDCDLCEKTWALSGKTPKCNECLPPLMPENSEALQVYTKVQNQHIMGMNGPIDLDLKSVKIVMDLLDIQDQKSCLDRVHKAYQTVISGLREKSK